MLKNTPSNAVPRHVELTVECIDLPPHDWDGHSDIWLGIQCGKEVVQEVKLPVESATFRAELRVGNEPAAGSPNFLGPYAQGTVQDRFVYLCWGRRVGGQWIGFRRAKMPIFHLTWDDIQCNRIHARLKCTDKKGGPICATLKGDVVTWLSSAS